MYVTTLLTMKYLNMNYVSRCSCYVEYKHTLLWLIHFKKLENKSLSSQCSFNTGLRLFQKSLLTKPSLLCNHFYIQYKPTVITSL